jgi:hypothetical protein
MRVYPLRPAGWLVVNAIIAEGLDPGPSTAPDQHLYRVYGVIVVCCHCRRTRRASGGGAEQWDWVPAWLADAPAEVTTACALRASHITTRSETERRAAQKDGRCGVFDWHCDRPIWPLRVVGHTPIQIAYSFEKA